MGGGDLMDFKLARKVLDAQCSLCSECWSDYCLEGLRLGVVEYKRLRLLSSAASL